VLANLDADDAIELTNGQFIWEWLGGAWIQDPGFPNGTISAPGFAAVADFGDFGAGAADDAEIAVVRNATVMVHALDGSYVMPPVAVPGMNPGGGPPTISDFDGDGLVEVGVAGRAFYTVYDVDCGPTPRPGGTCNLGTCDAVGGACPAQGYMLWSHSTQDISSNVTGSSIFDFEADGTAEVVYGDECFTRVYNGQTGEVLFSQYRSSCTWYENPIIADVDGNFRADLVTPSNKACSPDGTGIPCQTLNADGVDPQWNGRALPEPAPTACRARATRGSAAAWRATSAAERRTTVKCLEEGYRCAPPPTLGRRGAGDTCRAAHPHGVSGIRVYSDANDKWVRSRSDLEPARLRGHPHRGGRHRPARPALWENNWDDPELNNFRQNVPGQLRTASPSGDATSGATSDFDSCASGGATLERAGLQPREPTPIGPGIVGGLLRRRGIKVCDTTTMHGPRRRRSASTVDVHLWARRPSNRERRRST
jgi:hypothetical protein